MAKSIPDNIRRHHILEAISQFDDGKKHNFADSTGYDLHHEGRRYPPKAIVGLAAELVTREPYFPEDFSGGVGSKCFRLLEDAGFEIEAKFESVPINLEPGTVYKRTDLHKAFGGQQRGGISTPKNHPLILVFSGSSGETYGYEDGWDEDRDFYHYTGEGQVGHMEFTKGNRAIRDHDETGKTLQLFFEERKGYWRYHGQMRCVDFELFQAPDKNGNAREAIRFILEDVDHTTEANPQPETKTKRPYKAPDRTQREGMVTSRVGQGYYRQQVLEKYQNRCAVTGAGLAEILIASHTVPWRDSNDDERLDPENGILLSPNYDALFDKHLISFTDDGRIIFSPMLDPVSIETLGISPDARITVTEGMKKYLARHREKLR